jgi:hypothetical protein
MRWDLRWVRRGWRGNGLSLLQIQPIAAIGLTLAGPMASWWRPGMPRGQTCTGEPSAGDFSHYLDRGNASAVSFIRRAFVQVLQFSICLTGCLLSNTPDLGPVPQRITVGAEQVRRLVGQQFPRWAGLAVQPIVNGGWDNWTFRLGAEMLVRLPSAAEYAWQSTRNIGGFRRWPPGSRCRFPYRWRRASPARVTRARGRSANGSAASRPARTESPVPSGSQLTWPGS